MFSNLEWPGLLAGELLVPTVHRVVTEDEPDSVANCEINRLVAAVGLCFLLFVCQRHIALNKLPYFLHMVGMFKGGLVVDSFVLERGASGLCLGILPVERSPRLITKAHKEWRDAC